MSVQTRERIEELDVLRGLAFMAVVLQHAIGGYIHRPLIAQEEEIALGLLFNLAKFAVPAFIFISGVALFYNYAERVHIPRFLQKRGADILIPYVAWTLIYDIYYHRMPSFTWEWAGQWLHRLATGAGAYHLWYIVMIFQAYLCYPLMQKLFYWIRGYRKPLLVSCVLALCALAYALLLWFSYRFIPQTGFRFDSAWLQTIFVTYRDRNFLFYLYYFILGGVAGLAMQRWRDFLQRTFWWNLLCFLLLSILVGIELISDGAVNLARSTSLKPTMFVYTVFQLCLLYMLAMWIKSKKGMLYQALVYVGQYSFGAYLVHAIVLNYVIAGMNSFARWEAPLIHTLAAAIVAICCSLAITRVISLLPYGKLLIGPFSKPARRKQIDANQAEMG